jgi:probable rRNA maturation factor
MLVNLQRKIKLDPAPLRLFVEEISTQVEEAMLRPVSVALVSDRRMIELNKLFRGKDSTTDVLSFPNEPDEFQQDSTELGDIVISVEQAAKQAEEIGLTLEA